MYITSPIGDGVVAGGAGSDATRRQMAFCFFPVEPQIYIDTYCETLPTEDTESSRPRTISICSLVPYGCGRAFFFFFFL
jgi:hypothetical protein